MKAAEQGGIPAAFVVNGRQDRLDRPPRGLDEPLAKIVAGDWDATAMAKERLIAKTKERKVNAVRDKIFKVYRTGDFKAASPNTMETTSGDAELTEEFASLKFAALCNSGAIDEGLAIGGKLLEANHDKPQVLNNVFWSVINPTLKTAPDPRVAQLALKAARADELTGGRASPSLTPWPWRFPAPVTSRKPSRPRKKRSNSSKPRSRTGGPSPHVNFITSGWKCFARPPRKRAGGRDVAHSVVEPVTCSGGAGNAPDVARPA